MQSPIGIELNIVDLSFDSLDRQRNTCLRQGCHDRILINDQVVTDTTTKQSMSSYLPILLALVGSEESPAKSTAHVSLIMPLTFLTPPLQGWRYQIQYLPYCAKSIFRIHKSPARLCLLATGFGQCPEGKHRI